MTILIKYYLDPGLLSFATKVTNSTYFDDIHLYFDFSIIYSVYEKAFLPSLWIPYKWSVLVLASRPLCTVPMRRKLSTMMSNMLSFSESSVRRDKDRHRLCYHKVRRQLEEKWPTHRLHHQPVWWCQRVPWWSSTLSLKIGNVSDVIHVYWWNGQQDQARRRRDKRQAPWPVGLGRRTVYKQCHYLLKHLPSSTLNPFSVKIR